MTPGPIAPTRITPTPTIEWDVTSSNQLDSSGSYDLVVNLSVAATTPFPLRIGYSGSGIYNYDWKIDGLDANGEITVDAGVLIKTVRVLVAENLDDTEQHILTIENNGYYNVGVDNIHTATCTRALVLPVAANTGFLPLWDENALTTISGDYSTQYAGELIEKKKITGTLHINHPGVRVRGCWVQGYGTAGTNTPPYAVKKNVPDLAVFEYCRLGGTGAVNGGIREFPYKHTCIYGNFEHFRCHFSGSGIDPTKVQNGHVFWDECYIEKIGANAQPGVDGGGHGDCAQTDTGAGDGVVLEVRRSNIDVRIEVQDPLGYSTSSVFFVDNLVTSQVTWKIYSNIIRGGGIAFRNATSVGFHQDSYIQANRIGERLWNGSTGDVRYVLLDFTVDNLKRAGNKAYTANGPLNNTNGIPFNNADLWI